MSLNIEELKKAFTTSDDVADEDIPRCCPRFTETDDCYPPNSCVCYDPEGMTEAGCARRRLMDEAGCLELWDDAS